jgi:thiol-disulfide isomerase/thioredoxin
MNKTWIYAVLLLVVAFFGFYAYQKYKVAPVMNFSVLHLRTLENQPVRLADLKGSKLLVCFGASWCANCREELDILASIKETELQDVEIVVISDEPIDKVIRFKERKEYPFIFYKLDTPFQEIGIYSIPTSYIINRAFEVKKEAVGYLNWKDPSTVAHLKKLME